jgi:hypothetical protein
MALVRSGNLVFLGTRNNTNASGREIYVFDVSSPSSPVLLGSLEVGADVHALTFSGSWLIAATAANTREALVIDIADPRVPRIAASQDLPAASDAYAVASEGAVVAVTTQNGGTAADLHVLEIAPNGFPLYRAGLDLGANVTAVDIVDGLAFIGDDRPNAELAIVDLRTPSTPVRRATLAAGGAVRALRHAQGVLVGATANDNAELILVQPGGLPSGYERMGWLTSLPFDAGTESIEWNTIEWTASSGGVAFQIRSAADAAGLDQAVWVGPGGDPEEKFLVPGSSITLHPGSTGSRFVEWRATLIGDAVTSPEVTDVTLTYN